MLITQASRTTGVIIDCSRFCSPTFSLQAAFDRNPSFPHTLPLSLLRHFLWPRWCRISKRVSLCLWCSHCSPTIISLSKFYNMGQIILLPTSETFRRAYLESPNFLVQYTGPFKFWPQSHVPLPLPSCHHEVYTVQIDLTLLSGPPPYHTLCSASCISLHCRTGFSLFLLLYLCLPYCELFKDWTHALLTIGTPSIKLHGTGAW